MDFGHSLIGIEANIRLHKSHNSHPENMSEPISWKPLFIDNLHSAKYNKAQQKFCLYFVASCMYQYKMPVITLIDSFLEQNWSYDWTLFDYSGYTQDGPTTRLSVKMKYHIYDK